MNEIFSEKNKQAMKAKKEEEDIIKMYCLHDKAYTIVKSVWIVKGEGKQWHKDHESSPECESTYTEQIMSSQWGH